MRFYFEEAEIWEQYKKEVFQKINQSGLPLVLFGSTTGVGPAFLRHVAVPVYHICDNDPAMWGLRQWGLKIIAPEQLQELYVQYNVLILVPYEHEIIPQLQSLPVPPAQIFRLDFYYEEEDSVGYFKSVQPVIESVYSSLADQESRETYEAVIRYRMNRNPQILSQVTHLGEEQYFPPSLGGRRFLSENEVYVDAGAYSGDTIQGFLTTVQGQYRSIYAFEPESDNYKRLMENVGKLPNVVCQRLGIGDKRSEIRFSSTRKSSKADESGEQIVQIDTLDHLLEHTAVTFLKMDIEGMECAALRGAKKLIRKMHPKLAICTYHSNADMVLVPKLILELDPTYSLYFRHYSHALPETICYAV